MLKSVIMGLSLPAGEFHHAGLGTACAAGAWSCSVVPNSGEFSPASWGFRCAGLGNVCVAGCWCRCCVEEGLCGGCVVRR